MSEVEIVEKMSVFGRIIRSKLLPKHDCGFVCFNSRESAESAMEALFDKLFIGDQQIKLLWAKN